MDLKSSNKVDVNRWELEISIPAEEFSKEVDKIYNRQIVQQCQLGQAVFIYCDEIDSFM